LKVVVERNNGDCVSVAYKGRQQRSARSSMPSPTSQATMADTASRPEGVDVPEVTEFDAAMEAVNEKHATALPATRILSLQRDAADAYEALIKNAGRLKAKS
jgi:hypothetical protein